MHCVDGQVVLGGAIVHDREAARRKQSIDSAGNVIRFLQVAFFRGSALARSPASIRVAEN